MSIRIEKVKPENRRPMPAAGSPLGFGNYFTDHMFLCNYEEGKGWFDPRIVPYGSLSLDPACMALHYGQQAFEGMKAYHGKDSGIYLFRYLDNLKRLQRSSVRLCMPEIDLGMVSDGLKQLLLLDREWLPKEDGCSMYIRPNIIATDPFLGVRPSHSYLFYIIIGPVGAYYENGFNPVDIMVNQNYVRAIVGGIGEAKTGGNYGGTLRAQLEAKEKGFSQVLWLDGKEGKYVEEVGTMNIFFVLDGEIYTSPLTGSILNGITRDSAIVMLREMGYTVHEKALSIDEVVSAIENGRMDESFGTGTAAVISPVGSLAYQDKTHSICGGKVGPIAEKLYTALTQMQLGHEADPHNWVERIDL